MTLVRITIEQRDGDGLVDEEHVDMEAPGDLVVYESEREGAPEREVERASYPTAREAADAIKRMLWRLPRFGPEALGRRYADEMATINVGGNGACPRCGSEPGTNIDCEECAR